MAQPADPSNENFLPGIKFLNVQFFWGGMYGVGTIQERCTYVRSKGLSIAAAPTSTLGEIHMVWVAHAEVPCKGVVPTERLLLRAQVTAHLLLARVVDGVLVPCEVVRPREDGVARLPSRGVDALALVGSFLGVAERR